MAISSLEICFALFLLFFLSFHLTDNCESEKFVSRFFTKNVPALFIFGDSLVDSGNNNNLSGSKANFLPYGTDFEGGKPTGRFTNGKTVADYFAIKLELPLVPPYLGLSELQRSKISTGFNYASAGCGILPETGSKACLSLDNQTELFQRTLEIDFSRKFKKHEKLEKHFAESLFFISIGINDFVSSCSVNCSADAETFGKFLLNEFSIRLQRLYTLGARKFLVNNVPPFGCLPSNVVKMRPNGTCDEDKNNMVTFYNRKLAELLQQLQFQLQGAAFAYSDYFNFLLELRSTAERYGITDTSNPCCPEKYNGANQCLPHTAFCQKRDTFLFFDQHPSEIANEIYVRRCLDESSICTPVYLHSCPV